MKVQEKLEARRLRKSGWSIKDIARELQVAQGSVSAWVADVELTEEQLQVLEKKQARSRKYIIDRARELSLAAAARHERSRQEGFAKAKTDEPFRVICALYWGEGRKTERNKHFALSNADSRMLRVAFRWLLRCGYGERISFRVQYYPENGLTEGEIKEWWLTELPGLEERHFRKFTQSIVHRASQRKKVGQLPFGTATIQVCSTELFYQIVGGIDYLAQTGA